MMGTCPELSIHFQVHVCVGGVMEGNFSSLGTPASRLMLQITCWCLSGASFSVQPRVGITESNRSTLLSDQLPSSACVGRRHATVGSSLSGTGHKPGSESPSLCLWLSQHFLRASTRAHSTHWS